MFRLYDSDFDKDGNVKKTNIVGRIFKWLIYIIIAFIYGLFMIRIFVSCDPSESTILLFDDDTIDAYYATDEGNDFALYEIKSRDSFGDGDTFFVNNVIYLESAEQLQFTVRYKKNRMDSYNSVYELQEYKQSTGGALLTTFDLTLQISSTDSDMTESIYNQDYYTYQFESSKYYYHRVSFDNIKIDYNKTKIELFITLSGGDADISKIILVESFIDSGINNANIAKISEGDYFAHFTLFDVNTAKEKVKLSKYDTKTINRYTHTDDYE